ncbi:MAG: hypothetical protein OXN96_19080 [Bryobacterales bacterium]|nr:hypothetical protein [Bryobacterales bacterium]
MTQQMIRSELAWGMAVLATSAALFALSGRASMWDLAIGYLIVRALILAARRAG